MVAMPKHSYEMPAGRFAAPAVMGATPMNFTPSTWTFARQNDWGSRVVCGAHGQRTRDDFSLKLQTGLAIGRVMGVEGPMRWALGNYFDRRGRLYVVT